MVKAFSAIFGVGLAILWIAGLNIPEATQNPRGADIATDWLVWIDLILAIIALGIAAAPTARWSRNTRTGLALVISGALLVLWIVGLVSNVVPWLAWWNFAFAVGFLLVGLAASAGVEEGYPNRYGYRGVYGSGAYPFGYGMGTYSPYAGHGPYYGRGPRAYRRSDERIEEDINERLMQHGEVDATEVQVIVNNGEVTLAGLVDNRRARRVAEEIADSIIGVTEVHNELVIRRPFEERPARVA